MIKLAYMDDNSFAIFDYKNKTQCIFKTNGFDEITVVFKDWKDEVGKISREPIEIEIEKNDNERFKNLLETVFLKQIEAGKRVDFRAYENGLPMSLASFYEDKNYESYYPSDDGDLYYSKRLRFGKFSMSESYTIAIDRFYAEENLNSVILKSDCARAPFFESYRYLIRETIKLPNEHYENIIKDFSNYVGHPELWYKLNNDDTSKYIESMITHMRGSIEYITDHVKGSLYEKAIMEEIKRLNTELNLLEYECLKKQSLHDKQINEYQKQLN